MLALLYVARNVRLKPDDKQWPLRTLEYWYTPDFVTGIKSGESIPIQSRVVLRVEFVPNGQKRGPRQDIPFIVFPEGSSDWTSPIIGAPWLDPAPKGLGRQVVAGAHAFSTLNVTLPRIEDHHGEGISVFRMSASSVPEYVVNISKVIGKVAPGARNNRWGTLAGEDFFPLYASENNVQQIKAKNSQIEAPGPAQGAQEKTKPSPNQTKNVQRTHF